MQPAQNKNTTTFTAIINIRALVPEKSGGIIQNIVGVLGALFEANAGRGNNGDRYIVACTVFNRHLIENRLIGADIHTLPLHRYYDVLYAMRLQHHADVVFECYPREDAVTYDLSRCIFYIPDIQHEYLPEFFRPEELQSRRRAFGPVLAKAGAIGTISEFSRQTLLDQPETSCSNIFLMPPALQAEHETRAALTPDEHALIPHGEYLFFPANFWPHKNHRGLLQALRILKQKHGMTPPLVLTGAADRFASLAADFPDLDLRHFGYLRGELVGELMARAAAMPFFSFYEGFGIPLLEAFHCGTPVVCGQGTSLPEIGGDAVLYADPYDPEEMAEVLYRVLSDAGLRRILADRGRQRLALFSWERSAENLRNAMLDIAMRLESAALPAPGRNDGSVQRPVSIRPLVSIITPSFNQGRFIAETIESVLGQTYDNIEYIVMDGGSTDETLEVLKRYEDRLRWISEPDSGQSDAINKGMALAKGEILAYLNSDDLIEPEAVAQAVAFFSQNPDADMVYGEAVYIDEESRVTGDYPTKSNPRDSLVYDCVICQPAAFWRRSVARRLGPFDEALHYAMDYEYWLRMRKADAMMVHLPVPFARSRLHSKAKTISQRGKVFPEIFEICCRHLDYVAVQYFEGFVHYHLVERHPIAGKAIGYFPYFWRKLARLLRIAYFARHGLLRKTIVGKLNYEVGRGSYAARLVLRLAKALRRRIRGATSPAGMLTVRGFWTDNWLSRRVSVQYSRAQPAKKVWLSGTASKDATLVAQLDNHPLLEMPLSSSMRSRVEFVLPALSAGQCLTLAFSAADTEAGGRELAYLLDSTNLFAEFDLFLNSV
jgi:glycosyltransferase involved in cell wall biosynthesis